MAAMSDYLERKLLDHTLGTAAYTHPSQVYLALFTADPLDAGTGAEVSNSGGSTYARQTIDFNAAAGAGGSVTNSTEENFTNMPGCTVTHIGIYDSVDSSGSNNLLYHGSVSTPKTVVLGDTISLATGQLTVTLA